jgi:hypothetical protein
MDFRDAVGALRGQRLSTPEQSWIAPMDRKDRDDYPYRNKIGEVWFGNLPLGWGYAWFDPEDEGSVVRLWIQTTDIWRRGDGHHLSGDSDEERRVLEATKDVEFDAWDQDLPENSIFDEIIQDLRFSSEDGNREEDGLAENVPDS